MAEPINLNRARKARARRQARETADENALRFGRSKAARLREAEDAARARAALEGHRREGKGGETERGEVPGRGGGTGRDDDGPDDGSA